MGFSHSAISFIFIFSKFFNVPGMRATGEAISSTGRNFILDIGEVS